MVNYLELKITFEVQKVVNCYVLQYISQKGVQIINLTYSTL